MSERPVLGIDLGTTYSCVARLDENERVSVLFNSEGEPTTPSVVFYENDGNVLVGKLAKKEVELNEDRVVQLIKRHMGEAGYTVPMGDKELHPQQVSAIILRYIVEDALTELGLSEPEDGILADVVITVPAYFGAGERQATMDAGRIAGLNVVNIINEPTAAAIAYGLTSSGGGQTVLVYDLGGGTFDVTVIEVSPDTIRVIATGGDHALGGADWDERIQDLLAEEFQGQFPDAGDPREDRETGTPLGLVAEDLKKSLSRRDSDTVTVMAHGERAKIELSRTAVVERTEDLVTRTLDFTRDVLAAADQKNVRKIDELLLVGGMSRSPIIAQRLAATFPDLPEPRLMDPDQIVAKGAALFAARQVAEIAGEDPSGRQLPGGTREISGTPGTPVIINVTSKGYGIKVVDGPGDEIGHIEFLICPNDEIPSAPQDTFRTVSHNQREVNIEIFESLTAEKDPAVENNKLLVDGRIGGLPPGLPAGQPIEVTFDLGNDAILRIRAMSHGQVLTLEAKISGAMSEEELRVPLPNIQR